MSERTGWFGAAVLAAALAVAGAGCGGGPEERGEGGPPTENGTEPGGQPTEGMDGGEGAPAEPGATGGDQPVPPGEGAGGEQPAAATGGEGAPAGGAEQPPAPPAAATGGEGTTQPAGAGAAAIEPNVIMLEVGFGEGRQPQASVRMADAAAQIVAVKEGEIPQQLVDMLKATREQMTAAGQRPRVVVTGPFEVPFETVVIPVMRAAFRAGFQRADVEYRPPK